MSHRISTYGPTIVVGDIVLSTTTTQEEDIETDEYIGRAAELHILMMFVYVDLILVMMIIPLLLKMVWTDLMMMMIVKTVVSSSIARKRGK